MSTSRDRFRDFGILPVDAVMPAGIVRCSLSTAQIVVQYSGTVVILGFGLGLGFLLAKQGTTTNVVFAGIMVAGALTLAYFGTRDDYSRSSSKEPNCGAVTSIH
jgi:hypothetical protein